MDELRLITIPISHFCEKARWALELAEHARTARSATCRGSTGRTSGARAAAGPRRCSSRPTGPLRESAQIVRFADARRATSGSTADPLAAALEARFDAHLGPDARSWMYHRMLERRRPDARRTAAPGVPRWERAGLPVMLPLMSKLIVRRLDADDAHAADGARARAGACSTRSPRASATAAPTCVGDALQRRRPRLRRALRRRARPRALRHPAAAARRAARAVYAGEVPAHARAPRGPRSRSGFTTRSAHRLRQR